MYTGKCFILLYMNKLSVVLILALFAILPGCKSSKGTNSASTKQNSDLVDCNYYWPVRQRYVCIKDMPRNDCEGLFAAGGFRRETSCICDTAGKTKSQVEGTGYTQYDCK